jgi:hypothetical protein
MKAWLNIPAGRQTSRYVLAVLCDERIEHRERPGGTRRAADVDAGIRVAAVQVLPDRVVERRAVHAVRRELEEHRIPALLERPIGHIGQLHPIAQGDVSPLALDVLFPQSLGNDRLPKRQGRGNEHGNLDAAKSRILPKHHPLLVLQDGTRVER